jgi:hypothetical protein
MDKYGSFPETITDRFIIMLPDQKASALVLNGNEYFLSMTIVMGILLVHVVKETVKAIRIFVEYQKFSNCCL